MGASATPDNAAGKSDASADIPNVESPALVPEQGEAAEAPAATAAATALVVAAPRIDHAGDAADASASAAKAAASSAYLPRLSRIAATIAVAACAGAIAGSLATFAAQHAFAPAPQPDPHVAEARALKDSVAGLRAELAGVRAGTEATVKAANAQIARLNERIERNEKAERARLAAAQAAPVPVAAAATVAAAPSPAASPAEPSSQHATAVTGSIPEQRNAPAKKDVSRPPVIKGWVLQNVYAGLAYIISPEGIMEVAVGDRLPNGARVEAIRRENGRWVVLTTRGMVVMR